MMKALLVSVISVFCVSAFAEENVASGGEAAVAIEAPAAVAKVRTSESDIPLNIDAAKKADAGGSGAAKAMMSGMIILTLLGASYYFVRRYKTSNTINKSNMQIKVLSQHYLGPKKSLAIIRVAGESILVGVTDQNISMIKSLSLIDDEVPEELPKNFKASLNAQSAEAGASAVEAEMMDELDEEFSFAGVTDTVNKKIRSMRRFS